MGTRAARFAGRDASGVGPRRAPRSVARGRVRWAALALAAALAAAGGAAPVPAAEQDADARVEEARAAANAGEYDRARQLLEPLARDGVARAQVGLGTLYAAGHGVAQDDRQAADWFRRAAEQGDPIGQYNLGICRLHGRGVEVDRVEALMWISLSATAGFPPAREIHPSLSQSLSREEREEAKRRAREWSPR